MGGKVNKTEERWALIEHVSLPSNQTLSLGSEGMIHFLEFNSLKLVTYLTSKSGHCAVALHWAVLFLVKHNLALKKNLKGGKNSQYKIPQWMLWNEINYLVVYILVFVFYCFIFTYLKIVKSLKTVIIMKARAINVLLLAVFPEFNTVPSIQ